MMYRSMVFGWALFVSATYGQIGQPCPTTVLTSPTTVSSDPTTGVDTFRWNRRIQWNCTRNSYLGWTGEAPGGYDSMPLPYYLQAYQLQLPKCFQQLSVTCYPIIEDYNPYRRLYLIHLSPTASPDTIGNDYGWLPTLVYGFYTSQVTAHGGVDNDSIYFEYGSDATQDTMLLRENDPLYIALMKSTNTQDDSLIIIGITDTVLAVWAASDPSRQPSVNTSNLPSCATSNAQVDGSWNLPAATGGIEWRVLGPNGYDMTSSSGVNLDVPPGRDTIIAIAKRLSPNGTACDQVYQDTFYITLPYDLTITTFKEGNNSYNPKDTLDVTTSVGSPLTLSIETTPNYVGVNPTSPLPVQYSWAADPTTGITLSNTTSRTVDVTLTPTAQGQTVYALEARAELADTGAACPGKDTLYIRLTATPSTSLAHSPLNHLQLTPNPTSQISQLQFPAGKYQITVRDITGRTLQTAWVEGTSYTLQAPSRGIFLVEVTHGTQSRTLRWVVN